MLYRARDSTVCIRVLSLMLLQTGPQPLPSVNLKDMPLLQAAPSTLDAPHSELMFRISRTQLWT